ncbi:MAG: glutamate--tRNA ligase [Candidatus Hydrogenedentes bacterium]|nr:glutamate--tRNA ligase [Candidatus Hydrogenedentota bacterium]
MSNADVVRVRIAPSPTGFFHIGNAKTALINWLYARKTGGTFILRLEDTDVERSKEEYAGVVFEALHWLGIDWDEGPGFGARAERGEYGPYRQSRRAETYHREAARLIEEGKAYKCFCTKEELEAAREQAAREKRPPRYSGKCRNLTSAEIAARGDAPYAIRFKVPEGVTEIHDLVQGTVRTENREFDDFVIVKPNGDAIFHLAVVVDDGLMKISHVIRGDDHLTNATRHVMLFKALGYPVPKFAHLPMVLDEHGKKYSKRLHGANVLDWREDGFLPEALVNYLVLLGWTPGDNRELFTREELIELFSLERLGQSAGKFDVKKLQWLNGQHLRRLSPEELRDRVLPLLEKAGLNVSAKSPEWLAHMAAICQEKIRTLNEIVDYTDFFFRDIETYEEKAVRKQWKSPGAGDRMRRVRALLDGTGAWTAETLRGVYEKEVAASGLSLGELVHPTRLALTGKSVGPGLFELAELLGKETCLARIDRAIQYIAKKGEVPA